MRQRHTPVMAAEIVAALRVRPDGSYIDCTVGAGGHSEAILRAADPVPRLLGIDLDAEALRLAGERLAAFGDRVALAQGNFSELGAIAERHGFRPADGVLFDLGLSSMQVDTAERGFSFRQEAPLDMRFDPNQRLSAYEVVNQYSEGALADIIFTLGEEPRARRVARAIVGSRPLETTTQLAEIVAQALGRPPRSRIHPATRTFQAIRMEVNGELENLRRGIEQAIGLLASGGRLATISYHSLEDRLVKNVLRREASGCICPPEKLECECGHVPMLKLVSRRVIKPSPEEVRANPRSRSAKMRVAERI
ncbi:MAG: 16S rRNA (cytosine(1402)-N(4))-methyltransferase RsmH [Chloroflexi bacterium]|nr:16S rRNA (cytosine(1402)-N(4))-methyltransferase RsmH [Chloroflexota bacterium]